MKNFLIGKKKVSLIGLNSSWASEGDDDRYKLIIGEKQVQDALVQAEHADFAIVALHHPLEWIQNNDRIHAVELLRSKCQLVLHSHFHSLNSNPDLNPKDGIISIPAGLYEKHPNSITYNYFSLDSITQKGNLHIRRFSDSMNKWIEGNSIFNNIKNGIIEVNSIMGSSHKGGIVKRRILSQNVKNDTIAVFIHGLGGSADTSWTHFIKLIKDDPKLTNVDCFFFQYLTKIIGKSPDIYQCADLLQTELRMRLKKYKNIVLIGHGVGGLVIQAMIINALTNGRKEDCERIKHVVTLATPYSSSQLAKIYKLFANKQVSNLAITNDVIATIRNEWINRVFNPKIKRGEERTKMKIPLTSVVGLQDEVVTEKSVKSFLRYPPPETVDGGHLSMKEPSSRNDMIYILVQQLLIDINEGEYVQVEDLKIPENYRYLILDRIKFMDINKLMPPNKAFPISLPEIYIPLFSTYVGGKGKQIDFVAKPKSILIEKLAVLGPYLLVEGQTGSGKTTLLKYLAYTIALATRNDSLDGYLPVLIFTTDLSDYLKGHQSKSTSVAEGEKILSKYLDKYALSIDTLKKFCKAGKAIFLIDGLDEISPKSRYFLVNSLAEFHNQYKTCKMVLTSRSHGIDESVINRFGDRHVQINTLNMEQVELFVNKWLTQVLDKKSTSGQKLAKEMLNAIKRHEYVLKLIETPLLLTELCIYYLENREFPIRKAELYLKLITNLISKRFDYDLKVGFLETLAYELHISFKREFDEIYAILIMGKVYPIRKDESQTRYRDRLKNMFKIIEEGCGLFRRENSQISFWHMTFQEILFARYIVNTAINYEKAIKEFWNNKWFSEAIELFVSILSITTVRLK